MDNNLISWFVLIFTFLITIGVCYGIWRFLSWLIDYCNAYHHNQRVVAVQRMANQLEQKAATRRKIKPEKELNWSNIVDDSYPAPKPMGNSPKTQSKQKISLKSSGKRLMPKPLDNTGPR